MLKIDWISKEGIKNIPFLQVELTSGQNKYTRIPLADTPSLHSVSNELIFDSEVSHSEFHSCIVW